MKIILELPRHTTKLQQFSKTATTFHNSHNKVRGKFFCIFISCSVLGQKRSQSGDCCLHKFIKICQNEGSLIHYGVLLFCYNYQNNCKVTKGLRT